MTVMCNIMQCPFNSNEFCAADVIAIYNGYCSTIMDKHGRVRAIYEAEKNKREVIVEDGEGKCMGAASEERKTAI